MASTPVASKEGSAVYCPICDRAQNVRFKWPKHGYRVYSCRACKVEFLFPQPSDSDLAAIYDSNYFLGSETQASVEQVLQLKRSTAKLYLDVIADFSTTPGAKLLEIGCGSGDFLVEAQNRGFQPEGLEYSEHAAGVANRRLGRSAVRVGSLDSIPLATETYDIVTAFDVIEHVRNPKRALGAMYSLLRSGGLITIVTPSLDSWSWRLLGRYWMEYKPEHITYLSRRSLERLLQSAGFTDITFGNNYKVLTFDYIVRHFDRYPVPIVSPILRWLRRWTPDWLAERKIKVVASGMMALARKPGLLAD